MEKKKNQKIEEKTGLLKKAEDLSSEKGKVKASSEGNKKKIEKKPKVEKEPKVEKKPGNTLLARVILRVSSIIMIFILGAATFFFISRQFGNFFEVKTENKSALVEQQLSYCQELVTAKYRYSDIVTLKKTAGFAKSYSIIKYTGLIRAGIADFTDISYSLSVDGKKVIINMPEAEVLGNEIVNQEVFDEKQSIFVPITTQEVFDEIDQARQIALENMLAEGILEDCLEYAKKIIRQFMLSAGFEEVLFV
ncbi:MAG: DUF4230 domain-containing protein [Treponema sp.]|nr:DUF4230 domain-containing protein [Treponema sp.]